MYWIGMGEQRFWQVVGIGVGVSEEEEDIRESMVSRAYWVAGPADDAENRTLWWSTRRGFGDGEGYWVVGVRGFLLIVVGWTQQTDLDADRYNLGVILDLFAPGFEAINWDIDGCYSGSQPRIRCWGTSWEDGSQVTLTAAGQPDGGGTVAANVEYAVWCDISREMKSEGTTADD